METTGKVETRDLLRIRGSASIKDAAQLMCDMSYGALGVDDEHHDFSGLVTERDLLWAVAKGLPPEDTPLSEIVNDFPIVVEGPIGPDQALAKMASSHVRHLLIKEGHDLRILSMRDLMVAHLEHTEEGHTFASAAELRRMLGQVSGL
jgi:signal-transduction protein with cAMP-binding, CBS, and nucleotidyltransferase domain